MYFSHLDSNLPHTKPRCNFSYFTSLEKFPNVLNFQMLGVRTRTQGAGIVTTVPICYFFATQKKSLTEIQEVFHNADTDSKHY